MYCIEIEYRVSTTTQCTLRGIYLHLSNLKHFQPTKIFDIFFILLGWYYRRQFLEKRRATIVIQKCWRSYRAKKSYLVIKRGLYRLQAVIRSRVLTSKLRQVRGMIVRLQARCRGVHVRRFQQRERWAVVFLQRQVRAWIARKRDRRLRVGPPSPSPLALPRII